MYYVAVLDTVSLRAFTHNSEFTDLRHFLDPLAVLRSGLKSLAIDHLLNFLVTSIGLIGPQTPDQPPINCEREVVLGIELMYCRRSEFSKLR